MVTYNTHSNLLAAAKAPVEETKAWSAASTLTGSTTSSAARSNPPFEALTARSSNRIVGVGSSVYYDDEHYNPAGQIQRGYIRRTPMASDPTSKYQLKFMFNPTTIQRSYVSYLDQNAIDPYNTIFQAGNLVAPPGMLDFQFDLLYDRQVEVSNTPGHRGCLIDYDYFDRVIRAVEPGDRSPDTPPDSGILLVNPRDITVVFSPKLQVVGRVNTANVLFEKFSHNMIPTRMRVSISMKVYSFGENTQVLDFFSENVEATHKAVIPYENTIDAKSINYYTPESDEEQIKKLRDTRYTTDSLGEAIGQAGATAVALTGTPVAGLTYPPNLGNPIRGTYYQMPDPQPSGIYVFSPGAPPADRSGSRELVAVIYSVAKKWRETYPNSSLVVGDLNAAKGHKSHKKGVDVDITLSDRSACVAGSTVARSIQLGKWFIDTGIIKYIFFNDATVWNAVNAYARQQNKPGVMQYEDGHGTHFHVRISDAYIARY